MSNISIRKLGFCRNDYIKYSSQLQFTLLCDNVHMHLNRILAFVFGRYFLEVLWFKVQQLTHPAKSNPTVHIMASNNWSSRNSHDLGRVECSTNITYDEKRHIQANIKVKGKRKYKHSNQFMTRFFYKYFRCHTFRKTRFHVYLDLDFTVSML